MATVFVGTSGWSYPHWEDFFYPQSLHSKDWLNYYGNFFKTVEINSSFYHLPNPATLRNWREQTPDNFLFALKASRFITHLKRLKNTDDSLKLLLESASILGDKLGPILFQLPPKLSYKKDTLASFLSILPKSFRYTFEFRDPTWFNKECLNLLSDNNISMCFQDSPSWKSEEVITADFVYIRFHGEKLLYSSSYSTVELKKWANKIKKWGKDVKKVFAYFNNDAKGYAVENAKTLNNLLGEKVQ